MDARQLELLASEGGDNVSSLSQSVTPTPRNLENTTGVGAGGDNVFVTVIVKQAGFYGYQQRFTIAVDPDSHLLKAIHHERAGSKEIAECVLGWIATAVYETVLPMVSRVSEAGCPPLPPAYIGRADKRG